MGGVLDLVQVTCKQRRVLCLTFCCVFIRSKLRIPGRCFLPLQWFPVKTAGQQRYRSFTSLLNNGVKVLYWNGDNFVLLICFYMHFKTTITFCSSSPERENLLLFSLRHIRVSLSDNEPVIRNVSYLYYINKRFISGPMGKLLRINRSNSQSERSGGKCLEISI